MRYVNLGNSGLKVSVVSLGSWITFGDSVDRDVTAACVRTAVEAGMFTIDTADIYARGKAEEVLSTAIKPYRRQDLVIATKCFWPMTDNPNDKGLSRKHITESVYASLKRLNTDYIDLMQCHRYDPETPVREVVETMGDLIRRGLILYWGVSVWTAAQITEAYQIAREIGVPAPISNQPMFNMFDREIEAEIVPTSQKLGLGQIVWSPLAQGLLTGKYLDGVPKGTRLADDKRNRFMSSWATPERTAQVRKLKGIADAAGVSLAQFALAWCLARPGISSTIIGATRPEQVIDNAKAADIALTADQLAEVDKVLATA
jgi:voltage-dependent potassium channel beta subunit